EQSPLAVLRLTPSAMTGCVFGWSSGTSTSSGFSRTQGSHFRTCPPLVSTSLQPRHTALADGVDFDFLTCEVAEIADIEGVSQGLLVVRLAQTSGFATDRPDQCFSQFLRCEKVLHYQTQWLYICAMLIGYARVSKDDQDTGAQVAALKAVG